MTVKGLVLIGVLMISLQAQAGAVEMYTPKHLLIKAYGDGNLEVTYAITVDPSLHRVEVMLFGSLYERLLILNEQGLPLDHSVKEGGVIIDTLGAWGLEVTYSTPDLTSKVGRVWTISVASPIDFTVTLPSNSAIVGLSVPPTLISVIDGNHVVTLPKGIQDVSYLIGVVGTREHALLIIREAEDSIRQAKIKQIDVSGAEATLRRANEELGSGRYTQAELLAGEAKRMIDEVLQNKPPSGATPFLSLASGPWIAVAIVGLVAVIIVLIFRSRKRGEMGVAKTFRQVDLQSIFEAASILNLELATKTVQIRHDFLSIGL